MAIEPILWGVALAATAGLRVFMPFLFVGGMARYAHTPAPGILEWTASDAGFFLLLTASVLEVLGDKVPVVDHALDAVATFIKPAAGFLLRPHCCTMCHRPERGCSASPRAPHSH
jgi:hypothetical protein